jgi:uncharacterized protein YaaR (DUF327 family)
MIEIPKINLRNQTREGVKTKIKGSSRGSNISTFSTELENRILFEFHGTLEKLMADLGNQEKRFLDAQSLYELEIYKALVKKILKMILDSSFKVRKFDRTYSEEKKGLDEKTILDKIDENLIKLSQLITKSNEAFNLMKTIEEIRGLILDLRR